MVLSVCLGLIALFLIYLEFFVPGAILAVIGGITLLTAIILFAIAAGNLWYSVAFIVLMGVSLVAVIRLAIWKVKKHPTIFSSDDQSGYVASSVDKDLIGKEGTVLTNLRPSGFVLIDNKRYQVVSDNSYITKDSTVVIISSEGSRLICRKKSTNN